MLVCYYVFKSYSVYSPFDIAKLLHLFLPLQVIASSCKFLQDISL